MLTMEMPALTTASRRSPWYRNWLLEPQPPAAAVNLDEHGRRPGGLHQKGIQPLDIRVGLAVDDVAADCQARIAGKRQIGSVGSDAARRFA